MLNPLELDQLVKLIRPESSTKSFSAQVTEDNPLANIDPSCLNSSQELKPPYPTNPFMNPKPFCVSLFIVGYKLIICVIDSEAFDHAMPSQVLKALGLTLTSLSGRFFSMDSSQVPILGQVKDSQVALTSHPSKKLKLTILIADILTSYGILLSQSFCKDLGEEIQMDWPYATIPINSKKFILEPKSKEKFTVMKSDYPKSEILYVETGLDTYMCSSSKDLRNCFFMIN